MGRRVIIPFISVAIFLGVALTVDYNRGYEPPFSKVGICTSYEVEREEAAADVLFIGSSRTASAIDPVYIQKQLNQSGHKKSKIHKMSVPGTDLVLHNLLSRKYIESKGAPKHVFIELMYTLNVCDSRYARRANRDFILDVEPVSIELGNVRDFYDMNSKKPFSNGWYLFHRSHTNFIEFYANKLVTAFYAFLHSPSTALHGIEEECSTSSEWRNKYGFYGILTEEMHKQPPLRLSQKRQERLLQQKYLSKRMPLSKARAYENVAFQSLIRLFLDAGSESVTIYIVPTFVEAATSAAERQAYSGLFPDVENVLFIKDLYDAPPTSELKYMYRDMLHYNQSGALIVSDYFVGILRDML